MYNLSLLFVIIFVFVSRRIIVDGLQGMELVDNCYIEHQHLHLEYTDHFISHHNVVGGRTKPDEVSIEGVKCCDVMLDTITNFDARYEGLCDLNVECFRKWYGRTIPYATLTTSLQTTPPSHNVFHVCNNLTLNDSPVYYIGNIPKDDSDAIDETCAKGEKYVGDGDIYSSSIFCYGSLVVVTVASIYLMFKKDDDDDDDYDEY